MRVHRSTHKLAKQIDNITSVSESVMVACDALKKQNITVFYDLIFITESWLNDTVTNYLIDHQCHYHIVRRDRDGRGRRVCILL